MLLMMFTYNQKDINSINTRCIHEDNTAWEKISIDTNTQLENMTSNQDDIDSNYVNLSDNLFAEANKYIDYMSSSHKTRKMFKNHKPFWTSEVTNLWKEMKESEKL